MLKICQLLSMIVVMQTMKKLIFHTSNDQITLEYEDRILLTFTPLNEFLIPGVEDLGEYIRDTAIVNIIDNDSKQFYEQEKTFVCLLYHRTGNKF